MLSSEAEARLDRIKASAKETSDKVMKLGGAAAAGFAYGALNTRQGGNATTPYSVGGKVPLDSALAIAGAVLVLMTKPTSKAAPAIDGAAAAFVGIYTSRAGATWESNRLGAAPATSSVTPAPATTSGYGPMQPRLGRGHGQYGVAANAWQNAGRY